MKILIANYHYFIHGGADRYFFNVKGVLEKEGHTVIPFAFDYDETLDTPYRKYFPEPITGRGPCLLSQLSLSTSAKIKAVFRMFHNSEVNRKYRMLMDAEKPDVVFSIFLADSMLPNILEISKKEYGVPVIYRLSDFHMFCASHLFHRDGEVCTVCLDGQWSAVKYGCVHSSKLASALRVLQMKHIRYRRWYDSIDVFVCPSKIMAKYLTESGISKQKVRHLPTFAVDLGQESMCKSADAPYALYFGRINKEKGAEVLINAFNKLQNPRLRLKMVGHVEPSYKNTLLDCLDDNHRKLVDILAPQQGDELACTIRNALFVVHPAICMDNLPNSVIEAMFAGKAVIASNIGGLPDLVREGVNGWLFEPSDFTTLATRMQSLLASSDLMKKMGAASRLLYEQKYTEAIHIKELQNIFTQLS